MFKLDDNFLKELGLGSLPPAEKNRMLAHIYETLEMRVGMRLAEKMSNEQLDEFEAFINKNDEPGALKWLETNFPNYKQVVSEELDKLKGEISQVAPQIVEQSMANQQQGTAQPQQENSQSGQLPQQPQQFQAPPSTQPMQQQMPAQQAQPPQPSFQPNPQQQQPITQDPQPQMMPPQYQQGVQNQPNDMGSNSQFAQASTPQQPQQFQAPPSPQPMQQSMPPQQNQYQPQKFDSANNVSSTQASPSYDTNNQYVQPNSSQDFQPIQTDLAPDDQQQSSQQSNQGKQQPPIQPQPWQPPQQ